MKEEEKKLLKQSGIYSFILLGLFFIFWFMFSIQNSFGYTGTGTASDLKTGSRMNGDLLAQPLAGSVTIFFGTQSTSPLGTTTQGYISTNTTGLPKLLYIFGNGSSTLDFIGFGNVKIGGVAVGTVGTSIAGIDGEGTRTILNDPHLKGVGTISGTLALTGTLSTNGANVSGIEVSYLDNLSGNINTFQSTHQHGGSNSAKVNYIDIAGTKPSFVADGKTGTTTLNLYPGSGIGIAAVESGGILSATITASATGTGKSDVKVGTTTYSAATVIEFETTDFNHTATATTGVKLTVPDSQRGSTTPTANTLVKGDSSGKIISWLGTGTVVGCVYGSTTTYSATVASSAYIPLDDSIPQSGEGIQVMTLAYAPEFTDSTIYVEAIGNFGTNDNNSYSTIALFKDSEADARVAMCGLTCDGLGNQDLRPLSISYSFTSPGTSSFTMKMRGGSSISSANNFYVNGSGLGGVASRRLGGVMTTCMKIWEVK